MVKKLEENGHLSFDWIEELNRCEWEIEDILVHFNPNHPDTLKMIMIEVRDVVKKVENAWSSAYTDRTLADAQAGTTNMLRMALAMSSLGKRDEEAAGE
jgi:hypothetical protein